MSCLPENSGSVWAALGPPSLLEVLVPLRDEHARRGETRLIPGGASDIEGVVRSLAGRRASLLVIEDAGEVSGRSGYTSPFPDRAGDDNVLLGWLQLDRPGLAAYVDRAAAILRRRHDQPNAVVLLAPRERRYLALLDQLEHSARSSPAIKLLRWSAERIRRAPLIDALRLGAGVALYTGHGNASGWFAYGGINIDHLCSGEPWLHDHTAALVFSLSCNTGPVTGCASATEVRRGLADQMIARGVAGTVLAPSGDTMHENSRLLATGLTGALGRGCVRLREILARVRSEAASLEGYAVIGDPGLHAVSADGAALRGVRVFAPASEEQNLVAMREDLRDVARFTN
jgi:Peptidase family C25